VAFRDSSPAVLDSARRAVAAAMIDTVDTTERPLDQRGARSLPFGGGCAVALGVLLIAFGGLFALAVGLVAVFATRAIPWEQRWLIPGALLFVVLMGGGLLRIGLRDWRRAARGKEMAARHPDQPWFADWTWDPKGTCAESAWGGGVGLMAMMFILLVMAPFNVLWVHVFDPHEDQTLRLLALMVLIPDFFIYLLAKGIVSIVRDRIRFGRPYLAFNAFPFFLGESLDAQVTAKAFAGQEGVVATLRCIDERMASRRYRGRRSDYVRPFQLYEARQAFPGTFVGQDVALTFPLPAKEATNLLRQPARYWELEIRGSTAADIIRFTVPIYARPGV